MGAIHLLDKAVAELIAAGEVVERPASIAKELIENAIDAGADAVTVEIRGGGVCLLRVTDNGAGIAREDVPRAFLRHATSKLREAEDLDRIATLGFRGEALASIAAVCRVELTTRTREDEEGICYRIEGGIFISSEPAGCPVGTSIAVQDVFYNTPARMKFLKTDLGEGSAVAQVVDRCALSHPEIAFKFIRDGKPALSTSGGGELRAVIAAVWDRELAGRLLPVEYTSEKGIRVRGCVSEPGCTKPGRGYQVFFINGRFVRTRTCAAALEEAYKNALMSGRHPVCVLDVLLPPDFVDVNVHPAKIEVRFADEKPVFSAVYYAVKSALQKLRSPLAEKAADSAPPPEPRNPSETARERVAPALAEPLRMSAGEYRVRYAGGEGRPVPLFHSPVTFGARKLDIEVEEASSGPEFAPDAFSDKKTPAQDGSIFSRPATKNPENATQSTEACDADCPETPFFRGREPRLIGELFGTYILVERGDELLLVDKHAAHERILYERLRENISRGDRQLLLEAQAVPLPREDYAALLGGLDQLAKLGFLAEDFGGSTVLVREVPLELQDSDLPLLLGEIAGKLRENRNDLTPCALDRLYYSIACKSALRAGDKNRPAELREIVEKLRENPQITHCPHGRPVTVKLTRYEVEKLFGRHA